jgi:hypothetical protein
VRVTEKIVGVTPPFASARSETALPAGPAIGKEIREPPAEERQSAFERVLECEQLFDRVEGMYVRALFPADDEIGAVFTVSSPDFDAVVAAREDPCSCHARSIGATRRDMVELQLVHIDVLR